jgi:hypothetical protein
MLTQEQYNNARADLASFEAWVGGRTSYLPSEIPENLRHVTNEMRSQVEVYEFMTNPPDKYVLYIDERTLRAVTWIGDELGTIEMGTPYRDNFNSLRVPIRINAINGTVYNGTYYRGAGNYARVKKMKRKP